MAFQCLVLGALLLPGLLGEQWYQSSTSGSKDILKVGTRILTFSLLSFTTRCAFSSILGDGDTHLLIYFDTPDNFLKYMVTALISSFFITHAYIYLESLWVTWEEDKKEELHGK